MENNATLQMNTFCYGQLKKFWVYIFQKKILASNLAAVILGIALGFILKIYVPMTDVDRLYISFPGEILINMLQALTVPLIVTSVIISVTPLNRHMSRRIAVHTAAYFVSTTILSVTIGLILVLAVRPGAGYAVRTYYADYDEDEDEEDSTTVDGLLDLVRNMLPNNLIQACFQHYKTERVKFEIEEDELNSSLQANVTEVRLVGQYIEGTNTLGLIVWSFIFGMALNSMGGKGKLLVEAITILNETTKCVVNWILGYLPVAVLFIIAGHVVDVDDWATISKLGTLMGVIVLGLAIHGTVVLPLIYFLFVRRNPFTVFLAVYPALVTAAIVSSSSAVLSLVYEYLEDRLKIDRRIARFVMPIGNNLNKNGTALYELVAAVFIAQYNSISLDLHQLITLFVTSAVASTGVAGIPATGVMTTLIILSAVGLPAKEASILVFVEYLLDHCNTAVNVFGNCIGASLIFEVSKKHLEKMDEQSKETPRVHCSNAEGQTTDENQVHINSQDSDDESFYTSSEN
ncbi:excitatory amino acid transporter 3-like [Anabas testudineus]|uniref:Amino acid transporter n=1 Tax=Anabas testudineus TaxID=64144 RepID=A0A3Q1GZW6_ANATE|nr:excitatory amino acid transporter 3-like [Anabas testudineus]